MIFIAHKILLGKKRIAYKVLIRKPKRKNQLKTPEIDGRVMLNLI